MERLNWNQVRSYWQDQRARVGKIDDSADPDALGNVCHAGAPIWFNQYYARYQRLVFEALVDQCLKTPGASALDVGCGSGRWCRLLAERGYVVRGIDLQDTLIERNRLTYPQMKFECVAIQDFATDVLFDLVTTVTVIQHIPFDEQSKATAKIASIVKPGGYVLSLENIADQGAHVFAKSIGEWTSAWEAFGLRRVSLLRYDYSPAIRLSSSLVNATAKLARRTGVMSTPELEVPRAPTAQGMEEGGWLRRAVRRAGWAARRVSVSIDHEIEPLLIQMKADLPTVHCGFLFQKVV
jgi:2-polyprenyl-3-methyl-5-hydroxy-6-metoxy-1,4-benzoquinol methylase